MIFSEEFDYRISAHVLAPFVRPLGHIVFLDSAWTDANSGRYSYLAAGPSIILAGTPGRSALRAPDANAAAREFEVDPLSIARVLLNAAPAREDPDFPPFRGGWAGFVGYDFGAAMEGVAPAGESMAGFSGLELGWYDWVLAWDHSLQRAWMFIRESTPALGSLARALESVGQADTNAIRWNPVRHAAILAQLRNVIARSARGDAAPVKKVPAKGTDDSPAQFSHARAGDAVASGVRSNFTRGEYLAAVERVRELILDGDIFQANISQRFTALFRGGEDAFDAYLRLRDESPAPYAAFVENGHGAILSSSPEIFLLVDPEGRASTRPIKGTRPRSVDSWEDERLGEELLASAKDRAENLMIVDLLRNDFSRECRAGSVYVAGLCELERWANVQHLVSTVRGQLRDGRTAVDLFQACFPGGSITGAPKQRAMQIIADVEGRGRGVYCGAIGYFAADGGAQFNVAIRTLVAADGLVTFSAGGGIVLDSIPSEEYDETLAKAAGMFAVVSGGSVRTSPAGLRE